MKALLYSDWCIVKGVARQYPVVALAVAFIATVGGISSVDPNATALASHIHTTVVASGVMMVSFFGFFAFFGNDEREGWEAMRLSLPVTRRTVVRSRYVSLLAWILLLEVLVNLAGLLIGLIAAYAMHGAPGFLPLNEVVLLSALTMAAYLLYLSIEIPIFFKKGLTAARMYFSLPFFACMLFSLEPVQKVANTVAGHLSKLTTAAGMPLLLMAGMAIAFAAYYVSMLVSERIYGARDF